jgi:hypothetical protein
MPGEHACEHLASKMREKRELISTAKTPLSPSLSDNNNK